MVLALEVLSEACRRFVALTHLYEELC
jgi:hypothetical protein